MTRKISRAIRMPWMPAFAVLVGAWTVLPAQATETGGSSYPVGVETNAAGVMLPPGWHVFTYLQHYEGRHLKDNDGRDNSRIAYYKVKADVLAARLSYVWPQTRWLGASVESRAVVPIPTVDLTMGTARPAPAGPLDRSGNSTGLGDMMIAPVLLGWHHGALQQIAGVEAILPTGRYDRNAPVNVGRNYWQVAPVYAVTWVPGPWQLSGKLRYAVNGRNSATDYRSGKELSFEYSAGYVLMPGVVAGINGYMYRQTSDDRQAGAPVNGHGNRGRSDAVGPFVGVQLSPSVALLAKLQTEYGARNRPEGTRLWLQAKFSF